MNFIIRNVKLILAGLGIIVMFLVPHLLFPETHNLWNFVAIAAVIFTVLHGCLLWVIRYRQRTIRKEIIRDVKSLLRDRINNNLTKISIDINPASNSKNYKKEDYIKIIQESVDEISRLLDNLSEYELDIWKNKYRNVNFSRDKSS